MVVGVCQDGQDNIRGNENDWDASVNTLLQGLEGRRFVAILLPSGLGFHCKNWRKEDHRRTREDARRETWDVGSEDKQSRNHGIVTQANARSDSSPSKAVMMQTTRRLFLNIIFHVVLR